MLIFSEGRCINEWKLRPLKKGTARLALSAWEEDIPLRVLPTGINFSSFKKFGKSIHLIFSEPIINMFQHLQGGKAITAFNEELEQSLRPAVYEFHPQNLEIRKEKFGINVSKARKMMLLIPAIAGFLFLSPLYFPVRALVKRKWNNDHFDSIVVAILFLVFPIYLLLLTVLGLTFLPGYFGLAVPPAVLLCSLALLHNKETVED